MKRSPNPPNPYRVLGLAPGATPAEIKAAFRRAARRWHPDRNQSPEAAAKFREAAEVYRILITPPVLAPAGAEVAGMPFPGIPPEVTAAFRRAGRVPPHIGNETIEAYLRMNQAMADAIGAAIADMIKEVAKEVAPRRRRKRNAFETFLDFMAGH